MVCKVAYFNKNAREWKDKNGVLHNDAEIVLLSQSKDGKGYLPLKVRSFEFTDKNTGERRIAADSRIRVPSALFEKYQPKLGDSVNVMYNEYGNVCEIGPANH